MASVISGGGSQLGKPYPDGCPRVEFCGIDIDVTDRDRALGVIRQKLVELNTPIGTEVHYTVGNSMLLVNRPDNRGGYLVKVKYPSMSYYPGFVGSFLQPELEEYTR